MKSPTVALLLALVGFPAWAAGWVMEPDGSRLAFDASYQGEPVPGEFRRFRAHLVLDQQRPDRAALNVSVDLGSLDLGSGELEEGAATAEWFDTADYQQAEFRSRQVRQLDRDHYVASGTLSVKGVARAIDVPFVFQASGPTAVMSGELEMQRTWFNIGTGDWATDELIGFGVQVRFQVKWRRED